MARLFGIPGTGRLAARMDAAVRWRADEQAHRAVQAHDLEQRLARIESEVDWLGNELRRIAYQVAASEVRLADIDDALRRADVDGGPAREDRILAMVEAEHARIRARLTAVARYEERLRRLESPLSDR